MRGRVEEGRERGGGAYGGIEEKGKRGGGRMEG